MSDTSYNPEGNRVLRKEAKISNNFYQSDLILKAYLQQHLSEEGQTYMEDKLQWTGEQAATRMDALSMKADKEGPKLVKRNALGENIDEIEFHPAYWELMDIAVRSEMMRVKWEPELRKKFTGERHSLGFSTGYLYAMSESGQYCPLCMTDGVALLLDKYAKDSDRERLLAGIYAEKSEQFLTGAMFLTEKAGGSDVGANLVKAEPIEGDRYRLFGEKWFCSNANADIIFALARTDLEKKGTRGLSIFLLEPRLPDGSRNPWNVIRLKDKLGVRSMASAEIQLNGNEASLVGEEFRGFPIMADMINLSRLYNSIAALSGSRRALAEAYQWLSFRETFGKIALEHAMVRAKLWELGSLHLANFHLCWRAVRALDKAEQGDEGEAQLLRLLTPMVKKWSAYYGVYITRESMELMGGLGYIEDTVMPKLMRDVMVLPIWEGAGNIMTLDMLRALAKSQGLPVLTGEIQHNLQFFKGDASPLHKRLTIILENMASFGRISQEEMEYQALELMERLTFLYQISLIVADQHRQPQAWHEPALQWLLKHENLGPTPTKPPSTEEIADLIAWDF